jgi:hypothetical protein
MWARMHTGLLAVKAFDDACYMYTKQQLIPSRITQFLQMVSRCQ